MLRFFNRLLAALILIGIALIITLTNHEPATLRVGNWVRFSSNAGVIYLVVFSVGCISASIVGLFFGFKAYLKERRLLSFERNRQAFLTTLEKARSYMASREWGRARAGWEAILRRDPENLVARVELSRCLEALGDIKEALRVLDATRAGGRRSVEVLFRAAELNRMLGNNTAAMDNLALIVGDAPSQFALTLARNISEELGRVDDALEYHSELERLGLAGDDSKDVRARLTFAQILRDSPDGTTLHETLAGFTKRNPSFVPALEKLASIELDGSHYDTAAELLVKAAKGSPGDLDRWRRVIDLWLHQWPGDARKKAERAIASARASTQDSKAIQRIKAECLVAETMLALNKVEEALHVLDDLPNLARREGSILDPSTTQMILGLRGACLSQLGRTAEANSLWSSIANSQAVQAAPSSNGNALKVAPSPLLSTP